MSYDLDPLDPRKCRVCGAGWPVPSVAETCCAPNKFCVVCKTKCFTPGLALTCEAKHNVKHEVK